MIEIGGLIIGRALRAEDALRPPSRFAGRRNQDLEYYEGKSSDLDLIKQVKQVR